MKFFYSLYLFIFLPLFTLAQKPPVIPRISFLEPKVGAEIGLHSVWSVYPAIGLNFTYSSQTLTYTNGVTTTYTHLSTILTLDIQGRHYYNVYKRIKQNKDVEKFAANYICIRIKPGYVLNPDQQYVVVNSAGQPLYTSQSSMAFWSSAAWGLQRNIGRYGYYSFMLGPGVSLNTYSEELELDVLGGTAIEVGVKF